MFGFKFSLEFVLKVVYNLFVPRIPGLSILIPLDALMRIVYAVQVGMDHPIMVDWKFSDTKGLMKFLTELMQAAVHQTAAEQIEVIYELLTYLTNLEDFLSKEEFIAKAMGAKEWLPAGDVLPDEEMKKACELHTLAA